MNNFFKTFNKVDFIEKEFDFKVSPDNFIEWLKVEEEYIDFKQPYNNIVGDMCEYSCLYISMLLNDEKLKGKLFVCNGNFKSWGHFWMLYIYEGKEYILDLTLQQFLSDSPKLAVSISKHDELAYNQEFMEKIPFKEYLEDREAFKFYHNPHDLKTKPIEVYKDYAETMNEGVQELMGHLDGFKF